MAGRSVCKKDCLGTKSSRPARRRDGDANASRGLGREPQWESRGQSPLVLSAEDAAPARGGSPEGKALWCCPQRTPPRRGVGVQRAKPFGAVRRGRRPGEGWESRGQSPLVLSAEDITTGQISFQRNMGMGGSFLRLDHSAVKTVYFRSSNVRR